MFSLRQEFWGTGNGSTKEICQNPLWFHRTKCQRTLSAEGWNPGGMSVGWGKLCPHPLGRNRNIFPWCFWAVTWSLVRSKLYLWAGAGRLSTGSLLSWDMSVTGGRKTSHCSMILTHLLVHYDHSALPKELFSMKTSFFITFLLSQHCWQLENVGGDLVYTPTVPHLTWHKDFYSKLCSKMDRMRNCQQSSSILRRLLNKIH